MKFSMKNDTITLMNLMNIIFNNKARYRIPNVLFYLYKFLRHEMVSVLFKDIKFYDEIIKKQKDIIG